MSGMAYDQDYVAQLSIELRKVESERDKYIETIEQIFASTINYHMGLNPDEVISDIELHPVLVAVAEWSIGGRHGRPELPEQ